MTSSRQRTRGRPLRGRRPPARRWGQRWLAGILALLATLVWPTTVLHEATTAHAVCPEHGELLDVGGHEPAVHADEPEGPRVVGAAQEGDHELCPFVALGQPAAAPSPVPLPEVSAAEGSAHGLVGSPRGFPPVPILCLAPKQSPPL